MRNKFVTVFKLILYFLILNASSDTLHSMDREQFYYGFIVNAVHWHLPF